MQGNMNRVVQPCDGKRSASSANIIETEGSQSAAKIVRFKLDVYTSNGWDLPIRVSMVEYLKKYMHIHILSKDIKEKILRAIQSLLMSSNPRSLTAIRNTLALDFKMKLSLFCK